MDKQDWYLGQVVTADEMDTIYTDAEDAERGLASAGSLAQAAAAEAHKFGGILQGLLVTKASATSVDVTLGEARDTLGRRISLAAAATVLLTKLGSTPEGTTASAEGDGSLTAASINAGEAWLSLYLAFDTNLSDSRVDSLGNTINFRQAESFHFELLVGTDAPLGTATSRAVLDDSRVLLADILLDNNGEIRVISAIDAIVTSSKTLNQIGYGLDDTPNLSGRRSDWAAIDPTDTEFALLKDALDTTQPNNHAYLNLRAISPRDLVRQYVALMVTPGSATAAGGSEIVAAKTITGKVLSSPGAAAALQMPVGSVHTQLEALYDKVNTLLSRGNDTLTGNLTITGTATIQTNLIVTGTGSIGGVLNVLSALTTLHSLLVTTNGITVQAGGLTVTAGGAVITAGNLQVVAGNLVVTAGTSTLQGLVTCNTGLTVSAGLTQLQAGLTVTGGATNLGDAANITNLNGEVDHTSNNDARNSRLRALECTLTDVASKRPALHVHPMGTTLAGKGRWLSIEQNRRYTDPVSDFDIEPHRMVDMWGLENKANATMHHQWVGGTPAGTGVDYTADEFSMAMHPWGASFSGTAPELRIGTGLLGRQGIHLLATDASSLLNLRYGNQGGTAPNPFRIDDWPFFRFSFVTSNSGDLTKNRIEFGLSDDVSPFGSIYMRFDAGSIGNQITLVYFDGSTFHTQVIRASGHTKGTHYWGTIGILRHNGTPPEFFFECYESGALLAEGWPKTFAGSPAWIGSHAMQPYIFTSAPGGAGGVPFIMHETAVANGDANMNVPTILRSQPRFLTI
jgi:hypothetical protein